MSALDSAVRWLRSASGSSIDRLRDADDQIRARAPLTLRIAFLAADGGTGCSTACGAVAAILAARRVGPTLLVSAAGHDDALHTAGLSQVEQAHFVPDSPRRLAPSRLADAVHGLPVTDDGLYCLDLVGAGGVPASPVDWLDETGPLSRFLDVVCTDFGRRSLTEAGEIAASNHATVVVARPDRVSLERAATVVRDAAARGARAVLCVTDASGTANRRAIAELTSTLGAPAVVLAREPALASPRCRRDIDARARSGRYRLGLIDLAAATMTTALGADGAADALGGVRGGAQ